MHAISPSFFFSSLPSLAIWLYELLARGASKQVGLALSLAHHKFQPI
jgi:hypothetical protein